MAKLTEKQRRFCEEYAVDLNATQSAIRAGYSPNGAGQSAAKLLKLTKIQEKIENYQLQASRTTQSELEYVRRKYQELAAMAEEDRDVKAARGCFDSISRLNGLFVDKTELTHKGRIVFNTKK